MGPLAHGTCHRTQDMPQDTGFASHRTCHWPEDMPMSQASCPMGYMLWPRPFLGAKITLEAVCCCLMCFNLGSLSSPWGGGNIRATDEPATARCTAKRGGAGVIVFGVCLAIWGLPGIWVVCGPAKVDTHHLNGCPGRVRARAWGFAW